MKTAIAFLALVVCSAGQSPPSTVAPRQAITATLWNDTIGGLWTGKTSGFSGSGAPGSVANSKRGDIYVRTSNDHLYICDASPGPCTSVTSGQWVDVTGTASAAGSTDDLQFYNGGPLGGGRCTMTSASIIVCNGFGSSDTTHSGVDVFKGLTSGSVGLGAYDVAGTAIVYVLPQTNGLNGQYLQDIGVVTCPTYPTGVGVPTTCHGLAWFSHTDILRFPFANCVGSAAGSALSLPGSTTFTPACRGGSNNLNGTLQATPSTGATAYLQFELPLDWDTAQQPFLKLFYGSGSNTSGTVIWTASTGCTKADGSVSDDPAYNAESAMATQTMATANRMWGQSAQFTAITSGNNCIPGGIVNLKIVLSGTASSNINASFGTITIPRLAKVQAN